MTATLEDTVVELTGGVDQGEHLQCEVVDGFDNPCPDAVTYRVRSTLPCRHESMLMCRAHGSYFIPYIGGRVTCSHFRPVAAGVVKGVDPV